MASQDALRNLIAALEAEQKRRRKALFGGHDDPREALLAELQQMAGRLAATGSPYPPLDLSDMSTAEKLACHFLPKHLRPPGLPTVDEIWAAYETRK